MHNVAVAIESPWSNLMPIERREIEFSKNEFLDILANARFMSQTDSIHSFDFLPHNGGILRVVYRRPNDPNFQNMQLAVIDVSTAVLDYCRDTKIPLPRSGKKRLEIKDPNVILHVKLSREDSM